MPEQEQMRITVGDVEEVAVATTLTEAQIARAEAKANKKQAISMPMLITGIIIFLIAAFLVWKNGFATQGDPNAPTVDRNNTPETNLAKQALNSPNNSSQ